MSDVPSELLYTEEHEYLGPTDEEMVYTVGITDFAQGELGDIVYVELPNPGEHFGRMEVFGTVEAVKAVSDLFCPAAGTVVEVNVGLEADPSLVNSEPYGGGWMIKLRLDGPGELDELLGSEEYSAHIGA